MPKDSDLQRRRQMAIRDILKEGGLVADQQELLKRLRELGISATQPVVNRDLKALGAVRSGGRYFIPSWVERADESPFRRVLGLIRSVKTAGPHQTVIFTLRGAGPAVAAAIEESEWKDLVVAVASYSSVLVLTENKSFQDLVIHRLKFFREKYGDGGGAIPEPAD